MSLSNSSFFLLTLFIIISPHSLSEPLQLENYFLIKFIIFSQIKGFIMRQAESAIPDPVSPAEVGPGDPLGLQAECEVAPSLHEPHVRHEDQVETPERSSKLSCFG